MSNLTLSQEVTSRFMDTTDSLSQRVAIIFQWIVFTVLCQTIALFGIGSNVVNVICFVKQGFTDPVNVSLLGLTVSDLGSLITLLWTVTCVNPALRAADLPFESIEFQYLTSGMPHATFSRITGCITALITLERCLCITAPLKVKAIVTSKRVAGTIIGIYVVLIISVSPVYVVNKLGQKFFPTMNKTMIGLIFTEDREFVESVSFIINNALVPFVSFIIIIVCTATLTVNLENKRKWREISTVSSKTENISSRNQKVSKMVVMISSLFIACFVPFTIIFLAMIMIPGLSIDGKYIHILIIMGGLGYFLETINSSMNIFIYYNMSSRYRKTFHRLFSR